MGTWDRGSALREWLRKRPHPAQVRVRTEDGEERMLGISADTRGRWKSLEESVLASDARVVELLDKEGAIIRAQRIEFDEDGEEQYDERRKNEERRVSRERRDLADFCDVYGKRLNEAYERGAAAANTGQENLVSLVEVLTNHLSLAITNLHNVSVNLANMVTEHAGDEGGSGTALERVLGAVAVRSLGGPQPTTPAPPNGKKGAKQE
jgi:hypothetical protein